MFRVTVKCDGIGPYDWPDALDDVRAEFVERPWHRVVDVHWSGQALVLVADSAHDADGVALADELSDAVAAYAPGTPGYRVSIVSVEAFGDAAV